MKSIELSAVPTQRTPAAGWALAGLCVSMVMPSLDTSIANAGLPQLAQAFSASFQAVQWVVLSYLLAITSFIVSVGRLGDLLGRRRLLLAGIALFTTASVFCGAATTIGWLIAARAVQGVGAGFMMALTVALVGEAVPSERRGSAMGLLGTMSALGTTLGPSLGGVLMMTFGWPSIFLVNVPLGVLAFALAQRHLPVDRPAPRRRGEFDGLGTLLLALSLGAYALAMTLGHGQFGVFNASLLGLAALGSVSLVRVERRARAPLIQVSTFHQLRARLGLSALVSTVIMTTLVVGPFYLGALGLEPTRVGVALSVGPLVAALGGVPAGRLVDRFGVTPTTLLGLVGMTVGTALLTVSSGLMGYLAPLAVVTASYALFQTANNSALMASATAEHRGVVSGLLSLSRNLGLITGAAAMGAVFSFAAGTTEFAGAPLAAVTTGMRVTFALAVLVLVAALVVQRRAR